MTNPLAAVSARNCLLLLALFAAVTACGKRKRNNPDNEVFDHGRHQVTVGRYQDGIRELTEYLSRQPHGKQASRAGLFLGKSHFALGNFKEARAAWEHTRDAFPASLEGHKSRYKLALLTLVEGNRKGAIEQFKSLADHPDGPLAAEATAMVAYLAAAAEAE